MVQQTWTVMYGIVWLGGLCRGQRAAMDGRLWRYREVKLCLSSLCQKVRRFGHRPLGSDPWFRNAWWCVEPTSMSTGPILDQKYASTDQQLSESMLRIFVCVWLYVASGACVCADREPPPAGFCSIRLCRASCGGSSCRVFYLLCIYLLFIYFLFPN